MPPAATGNPPPATGNPPRRRAAQGSPKKPSRGNDGSPPIRGATKEEKQRIEALQRREEIQKEIERLQKEDRKLTEKTAAMLPPTKSFKEFEKRKGFRYHTWFKALGSMESLAELKGGDSPQIVNDFMEHEDYDIPSAFYSHTYLGKVKWDGIRDRELIIDELNFKAPWSGNDFRAIYAKWEYVYRVVESVGDVVVNIYEYRAKQPRNHKDKVRGWKNV